VIERDGGKRMKRALIRRKKGYSFYNNKREREREREKGVKVPRAKGIKQETFFFSFFSSSSFFRQLFVITDQPVFFILSRIRMKRERK